MALLYHHWLSPASRFVRIALEEKRVPFVMKIEKEWERRPAFLALSPAGEVPVYVQDDGRSFSGAVAIAEYLEEAWPEPPLLPSGDMQGRFEARRLVGWFHTKLGSEATRLLVTEKLFKRFLGLGEPDANALVAAAHNLKIHLKYISHLADRRHYLAGDAYTMADAAAAAHISVADYFGDIDWKSWPMAKDWYSRVKSRRAVRAILADRIPGLAPPAHYGDPDY